MAAPVFKENFAGQDVPFLNVRNSVRGFVWRDRLVDRAMANTALAISQRHGLPEVLGRVLAARDVGLDGVELALNPTLKELMPEPNSLRDMEPAAERIAAAIINKESVAIFGDYDVDGASSSALLGRLLSEHGLDARIYIPDRIFEGYGPNPTAIETLLDEGADLIITVDCGTTSFEAFEPARKRGKDIIVVDHHQADEWLPDVFALINPNRHDDLSGMENLAAAGVVYLLLVAIVRNLKNRGYYSQSRRPPDLLAMLDIVALATVCDVVPLKGLNRAYVTKGLQVMHHRRNVGLRALGDIAGLKAAPTPYHLGFMLGPRINAGGRIGDAGLGARLLASTDEFEANEIATVLDRLNGERKDMENRILEEALGQAEYELEGDPDCPIVVVGSQDWHKGLVGLVSSRITEKFVRPSLVISWDEGELGTGSARSLAGIDLGAVIRAAVQAGHLVKGGGHMMAAGMTVHRDKLADLKAFFSQALRDAVTDARSEAALFIDGSLTPRTVTPEFIDLLERAGPFGAGNPSPRFALPSQTINFSKIVGETHIKCRLTSGDGSSLDAIAFRAVDTDLGDLLLKNQGRPVHVAGHLQKDSWGGRERVQMIIGDAAKIATR